MSWYNYENDGLPSLILVLQDTVAAMGHVGPLLPSSFKFPFSICKSFGVGVITTQFKKPRLKSFQSEINKSVYINTANAKQNKSRSKNWLCFYFQFEISL